MYTSDRQLLKLIDLLKEDKVIVYDSEFCEAIGLRKQNLVQIRTGDRHFTVFQIQQAIDQYRVNANWIFGASEEVFKKEKAKI